MAQTKLEEIVSLDLVGQMQNMQTTEKIRKLAETETEVKSVYSSINDDKKKRRALILIDEQNDFISPQGALPVAGAVEDTKKLISHIYNNIDEYTEIFLTLDTHDTHSIFHPIAWGVGKGGTTEAPPFTEVSVEKVQSGEIIPRLNPAKQIDYIKALEETSKKKLIIWPYHCIVGTVGHAIENQLMHMITFFELARKSNVHKIVKGSSRYTEHYGAIRAEVDPTGTSLCDSWLKNFGRFESIDITGQAKDYCLYETVKQICEYFEGQDDILKKINVLENTSSVIGDANESSALYQELVNKYGITMKTI